MGLGLGILSRKPFLKVINLAFPQIKEILDKNVCQVEKEYWYMKALVGELVMRSYNL